MKTTKTKIKDLLVIELEIFDDNRGYFFESFSEKKYADIGIEMKFVQDNISKSRINTIRGLHYQVGKNVQGKLCSVIKGMILDVAVDIRFDSPTFGEYFSIILSEENKKQLWIPPGFAHGFSVLSDTAISHYKCTGFYNKKDERTIIYNDDELNIDWQVDQPIISSKDIKGKLFKEIEKDFIYS